MRDIFPRFEIVPIQAIDSGQVHPRARFTLCLDGLVDDSEARHNGEGSVEIHAEVDLFDPPKHIAHLQAVRETKQSHPTWGYVRIARALTNEKEHVNRMTVKRAFTVIRQMEAEGLDEPYRVITAKPDYASRWKQRNRETGDAM